MSSGIAEAWRTCRTSSASVDHWLYALVSYSVSQCTREIGDDHRIDVEGTIADHRTRTVIEIEHRREAEIDAVCAQLARNGRTDIESRCARRHRILVPSSPQRSHRRQRREFIAAKALHAPAFVIDADEQFRPQCVDRAGQRAQLR